MAVQTQEPLRKPKVYRPVSETRKVRKPLMERKRRERINSCLEQLALLLKEAKLVAADKPVAKLEKADILELTVRHLKSVRRVNFISEGAVGAKVKKEIENPSSDTNSATRNELKQDIDDKSGKQNDVHVQRDASPDEIRGDKEPCEAFGKRSNDSNYLEGFHKCLSEVRQATEGTQEFCALKERLFEHLDSCLHNLTLDTSSKEKIGTEKGAPSQANDCEIKARKKRKRNDMEGHTSPAVTSTEIPSELTLVPMQLTDGRVAFLVHGDAKILIPNKGSDDAKSTLPSSGVIAKQVSNDCSGKPKKCPKLLPASELQKAANIGNQNSTFDCKSYCVTPSPVVEGATKTSLEKISHNDAPLPTPTTAKVTNLLKLYPNIKTVSLPVGTCVTNLQSNNFITVVPSAGCTQVPEKKLNQSTNINANGQSSQIFDGKQQKSLPTQNTLFSHSLISQTPLLTSISNHPHCTTSQSSVRKCVVYPGSHLVSTTVAAATPAQTSQVVYVSNSTSQCDSRATQTNNAIFLSDCRVSQDPNRSLVNINQIPGPSVVSFPPTPPPSADQYVSELHVDGSQHQNTPSSFGSTIPNSTLKTNTQSRDLPSPNAIISGMYSYLQHCNPTSQTFIHPTPSMTPARDEEEFIDVENISKEDLSHSCGPSVNNDNLKFDDGDKSDMWRPW